MKKPPPNTDKNYSQKIHRDYFWLRPFNFEKLTDEQSAHVSTATETVADGQPRLNFTGKTQWHESADRRDRDERLARLKRLTLEIDSISPEERDGLERQLREMVSANGHHGGPTHDEGPVGDGAGAAEGVFAFLAHLAPRRIMTEEVGDAMEVIHATRSKVGGRKGRWLVRIKIVTTVLWVILNGVREVMAALLGKKKGGA